jgi:hypothetical protein
VCAFDPPPSFPGYLKPAASPSLGDQDLEALVKAITDQVLAALK